MTVASYTRLNHFNDTVDTNMWSPAKIPVSFYTETTVIQHVFSSVHVFIAMAIKIYLAIINITNIL